ncbi:MAG: hypothetical protein IKS49_03425 [Actinomycetaceae bacterium]|nr:hypothetical protein [Actinomycetaceae bacterium]
MSVLLALRGSLESEVVTALGSAKPPIVVARRCADLAEVLAAAQAGIGSIAVIEDADMTFIHDLHSCGVQIVAVGAGENGRERGIDAICSPFAAEVLACVQSLMSNPLPIANREVSSEPEADGRLIAVWGTAGSPGRSVLARDLAAEFAARACGENERVRGWGRRKKREADLSDTASFTLLIDADTYSPSLAQLVALNQESSALIAAARHINMGKISTESLSELCVPVGGFSFLAGLNVGSRWREIPSPVARELFTQAKKGWGVTVVDCAAQAEKRDFSYDDERDGVTCELLEAADDIVIVGQAGVLGVRRLLNCLDDASKRDLPRVHIAVTRTRKSRKTGDDRQEIGRILAMKGYENVHWISDDRSVYEEAENRGMLLREVNASSQAVKDIAGLADAIASSITV